MAKWRFARRIDAKTGKEKPNEPFTNPKR